MLPAGVEGVEGVEGVGGVEGAVGAHIATIGPQHDLGEPGVIALLPADVEGVDGAEGAVCGGKISEEGRRPGVRKEYGFQ